MTHVTAWKNTAPLNKLLVIMSSEEIVCYEALVRNRQRTG